MVSPWQSPLPLEEYATSRVVVYFHSDRLGLWVPILYFGLTEALALYNKGLLCGVEFFIFPPDVNPNFPLNEQYWKLGNGQLKIHKLKYKTQNKKIKRAKFKSNCKLKSGDWVFPNP
jgi:hypothetical protein